MIDPFDLIPVWGTIGHLQGYIRGLTLRIKSPELKVEESDLVWLKERIEILDNQLRKISGLKEENASNK